MPSIQITSPLPGDTVPTNVLVSGVYSMLNIVGAQPDKPPSAKPPMPPPPPMTQVIAANVLTIVITVKDEGGIQLANPVTLTVIANSGNFAMMTPFTNHTLLAGKLDCKIDAVLKEGNTEKASDTVDSIDFAASGVAGGGTSVSNSPGYP